MATAPKTDPKHLDPSGKDLPPELQDAIRAPAMLKALEKGYYDGTIREKGDVFENTLNLKPKGEGPDCDPHAWYVATNAKPKVDDEDMA